MKGKKKSFIVLKLLLIIALFIIIVANIFIISIYFSADLDEDALVITKSQISVFAENNRLIENELLNKYISYSDISPNVINAFVALEDKRFFEHNGLDYRRILGALFNDLKTMSFKEGASTITQQLAKNTMLSNEKTIKRKISEMRLAHLIEKKYTKEQILEMYLNAIYYGCGIYGIDSASKIYFNKKPADLTIAESAILAGIVKNPGAYSPKINLEKALYRKKIVLNLMLQQNYITQQEYDDALIETYSIPENNSDAHYYIPYYNNVLIEASNITGIRQKQLIKKPLKIFTFFDDILQKNIATNLNSSTFTAKNQFGSSATSSALVADNKNGGIVAFYSNNDIDVFSFRRQPASTIKPILVYAPALELGRITPETFVNDEPLNINGYKPNNYNKNFSGWITTEQALSHSVNTVAVRILNDSGLEFCQNFAEKTGLVFDKNDGLASALGGLTYGSTQLELAEAYMTLASEGKHKSITFIKKIVDENNNIIYEHHPENLIAMSDDTAYLTTSMLTEAVKSGTSSKLNCFNYEIAAKTGTTQSIDSDGNSDAWSISYTTEKTVLVWFGDIEKNNSSSLNITGSGLPTLFAKQIYSLLDAPKEKKFVIPDSVISLEIDKYALEKEHILYLANAFTPLDYRKTCLFSLSNYPTSYSPYFDINDIIFDIINDNGSTKAIIESKETYTYLLEEKNLLLNETNIYCYNGSGEYVLPKENPLGIYSYRLKVFFNGKAIGTINVRHSFFNNGNEEFPYYRSPLSLKT